MPNSGLDGTLEHRVARLERRVDDHDTAVGSIARDVASAKREAQGAKSAAQKTFDEIARFSTEFPTSVGNMIRAAIRDAKEQQRDVCNARHRLLEEKHIRESMPDGFDNDLTPTGGSGILLMGDPDTLVRRYDERGAELRNLINRVAELEESKKAEAAKKERAEREKAQAAAAKANADIQLAAALAEGDAAEKNLHREKWKSLTAIAVAIVSVVGAGAFSLAQSCSGG